MICDDCCKEFQGGDRSFTTTGGVICPNCARLLRAATALKIVRDGELNGSRIVDLLADLMYYCKSKGISFSDCLRNSEAQLSDEFNPVD